MNIWTLFNLFHMLNNFKHVLVIWSMHVFTEGGILTYYNCRTTLTALHVFLSLLVQVVECWQIAPSGCKHQNRLGVSCWPFIQVCSFVSDVLMISPSWSLWFGLFKSGVSLQTLGIAWLSAFFKNQICVNVAWWFSLH